MATPLKNGFDCPICGKRQWLEFINIPLWNPTTTCLHCKAPITINILVEAVSAESEKEYSAKR